jgi:hypothetical protein
MTPAEQNRAKFPELAAIVEELRLTGDAKLIWAVNKNGQTLGPVPAHIRADIHAR